MVVPGVENLLKLGGLAPPLGTLVVPGTTWHHPMSVPGGGVLKLLDLLRKVLKVCGVLDAIVGCPLDLCHLSVFKIPISVVN